jgi:hypothetical protein
MIRECKQQVLLEYQSEYLLCRDVDHAIAKCIGLDVSDITWWFGECPVRALPDLTQTPSTTILGKVLPMAETLACYYRDLLPVELGLNMPDFHLYWYLMVGDRPERSVYTINQGPYYLEGWSNWGAIYSGVRRFFQCYVG